MSTFSHIVKIFEQIENTSSRLEMEQLVIKLLDSITPEEASIVSYILTERISPMFVSTEFNMSLKSVIKAIQLVYPKSNINKIYSEVGDIGKVIEEIGTPQNGTEESIVEIYGQLWRIARYSGTGSVSTKINELKKLLEKISSVEQKYISRLITGKMRLGCTERTILSALKKKYPDHEIELEYALGACSDIGYLVQVIKQNGIEAIKKIDVQLGIPVGSQLVERATESAEIIKRYKKVYIQPKYDGLRCQIHIFNNKNKNRKNEPIWSHYISDNDNSLLLQPEKNNLKTVKLFSRNLEEITHMFPDLVANLMQSNINNTIFDSEIVGIDKEGNFLNFQDTIKRKRKHDITDTQSRIPIKCFIFDCMYYEKSIIKTSTTQRLKQVDNLIKNNNLYVKAPTNLVEISEEIDELFIQYVGKGLEGIIAKNPTSNYQPGLRNFEWIKLKKSTNKQFADTLDVVVLGYYLGTGRRTQFGLGTLLTGILKSRDSNEIVTIAKVGTGISDQQLKSIKQQLDKNIVDTVPNYVDIPKELTPDVIVEPSIVCVVEADEISKSDIHTSGLSLRFPRLIEFGRIDKGVGDITTLTEISK